MYNWPKNLDSEQSTTYKSQGVHKNRDSTAKMQLEAKDREGRTDAEIAAEQTAANMTPEKVQPKSIGVDEPVKIAKAEKDITQEQQKAVNKTSAANVSSVTPGGWRLPYPGMGDRSSFGDGPPTGSNNLNQEDKYKMAASIMESDSGGGGQMGGMMGGMSGGGGGSGAQGAVGAMSGQIGNDIAAMDDEIDQATEALFQDDSVGEAHRALGEKLQGR